MKSRRLEAFQDARAERGLPDAAPGKTYRSFEF
jgi:hypothetical protein